MFLERCEQFQLVIFQDGLDQLHAGRILGRVARNVRDGIEGIFSSGRVQGLLCLMQNVGVFAFHPNPQTWRLDLSGHTGFGGQRSLSARKGAIRHSEFASELLIERNPENVAQGFHEAGGPNPVVPRKPYRGLRHIRSR